MCNMGCIRLRVFTEQNGATELAHVDYRPSQSGLYAAPCKVRGRDNYLHGELLQEAFM